MNKTIHYILSVVSACISWFIYVLKRKFEKNASNFKSNKTTPFNHGKSFHRSVLKLAKRMIETEQ